MGLFSNLTSILTGILICLLTVAILWIKKRQRFFENKGVKCPPINLLFGNFTDVVTQKVTLGCHIKNMYQYFRSQKLKHGGLYLVGLPLYVPIDIEIIKNILQKDFSHFVDRGVYYNAKDDPLSANLFCIEGSYWRNLRIKFTPTFTSGKMRIMFPLVQKCADNLVIELSKRILTDVDIGDMLARFTTDVIGCCAFGIECNSFEKPENEFRYYGKRVFKQTTFETLRLLIAFIFPDLMRRLGTYQNPEEAAEFFMDVLKKTIHHRENNNNIIRKDFLQLLLELKNQGTIKGDEDSLKNNQHDNISLTENEVAAQCFIFFIAGFETTSTTMTFCLYELAVNQEIQKKTREEIVSVLKKYDGVLTYEAMAEMDYLNKVIKETLRKYPPLPVLNRICTKDYKIPGTEVILDAGTKLMIPVLGIHHDEEYYPHPEVFDPERFSDECKDNRPAFSYLPFGEGPRICLGLRFGMMQTVIGICSVLTNFKVFLSSKTKTPIEYDPNSFILSAKGGIWLMCEKIREQ